MSNRVDELDARVKKLEDDVSNLCVAINNLIETQEVMIGTQKDLFEIVKMNQDTLRFGTVY